MSDFQPFRFPSSSSSPGEGSFAPVWYRLDAATRNLEGLLRDTIGLDTLTVSALTAEETRPRCSPHGDGALVILRGINTEPGADPEDMVSLRMWIDAGKVVTFQNRRLWAVDELVQELGQDQGPGTPGEFLVSLADRMTDRMQDVVDEIDTELET